MSRTDVHRPVWVWQRDPCHRNDFRPYHRHVAVDQWDPALFRHRVRRLVPCDLPPLGSAPGRRVVTRCFWEYAGATRVCGCGLCRDQPGRRLARRRERQHWRRACRQLRYTRRPDDAEIGARRFT